MRSLPHSLINWPRAPRPGPHAPSELPLPPRPPRHRDQSPPQGPTGPTTFSLASQVRFERSLVRSNCRSDVSEPNRRRTYGRNEYLLSSPLLSPPCFFSPFLFSPRPSAAPRRRPASPRRSLALLSSSRLPVLLPTSLPHPPLLPLSPSAGSVFLLNRLLEHYLGVPVFLPQRFVLCRVASTSFPSADFLHERDPFSPSRLLFSAFLLVRDPLCTDATRRFLLAALSFVLQLITVSPRFVFGPPSSNILDLCNGVRQILMAHTSLRCFLQCTRSFRLSRTIPLLSNLDFFHRIRSPWSRRVSVLPNILDGSVDRSKTARFCRLERDPDPFPCNRSPRRAGRQAELSARGTPPPPPTPPPLQSTETRPPGIRGDTKRKKGRIPTTIVGP